MAELETMLTLVVREADKAHERVGGGTKHWVRDCFAPALENFGLTFITLSELELMRHELTTLRAENERLREMIGNAPHTDECDAESFGFEYGLEIRPGDLPCNCWKKSAARQEEG